MATQEIIPQSARLAEERQALNAVISSSRFKKNPRLTSLLAYICARYFEGDTDGLKEYSIAADVFRRPETFDQTTDSIVRVEAYRLRRKLREFYENEGASQPIEIVVAIGQYLPKFVDRSSNRSSNLRGSGDCDVSTKDPTVADQMPDAILLRTTTKIAIYIAPAVACLLIFFLIRQDLPVHNKVSVQPMASVPVTPGKEVRIRCGYTKTVFKDREGNLWVGDQYFTGGGATELRDQYIARTRDPELYRTSRSGTFSYKIPVEPGTYEMRLYFAETTYSPESTLGGGENSRVFNVQLNERPLLTQFDIVADGGANTADVRVFKDVHPGPDGTVQLKFSGVLGSPMINAIEMIPGVPHQQLPIRMVAQDSFFVDRLGQLWSPDTYFSGGQLAVNKGEVIGTEDPGLYSGERYGNFSYSLPVDRGSYKLTLYFAERYWGTSRSRTGGIGSRIFDVFCNGTALVRNLDVLKEAGPGRVFKKTFHGLHANAQGKLVVSLVPDVNYATVDAIELEEESP